MHRRVAPAASLRRMAKAAFASYGEATRSEWVLHHPAQLVIAVSQVFWCAAVEERLRSSAQSQGLSTFLEVWSARLCAAHLCHTSEPCICAMQNAPCKMRHASVPCSCAMHLCHESVPHI
eukprot:363961-Chlamydomonas_euryale.AAC.4